VIVLLGKRVMKLFDAPRSTEINLTFRARKQEGANPKVKVRKRVSQWPRPTLNILRGTFRAPYGDFVQFSQRHELRPKCFAKLAVRPNCKFPHGECSNGIDESQKCSFRAWTVIDPDERAQVLAQR